MAKTDFYFDDPDGEALAKETSHPNFVQTLTEEFYYDCTDDFSPFGNDDGADLLFNLEDWYREKKGKGNILKWMFNKIDECGFTYASEGCAKILDQPTLDQLEEEDPDFLGTMDNMIIAAAFGQFKISGEINKDLKELALIAIKRQQLLNEKLNNAVAKEHNERLEVITNDLKKI
jgi:uncharacterized protein YfeS